MNNLPLSARLTPTRNASGWISHGESVFKISINGISLEPDRFTSFGRCSDIVIYDHIPWVSRKHFEVLANRNGDVWVRDTNSKAGTHINGSPLDPGRWVKLGWQDQLTLGGILPVTIERTLQMFKSHSDGLFKSLSTSLGKIEAARKSKLRSCKTVNLD